MSNSKKILICDDEEGIRESLNLILSDDFNLILTDNSEQALNILQNDGDNIGLLLLDIKMPKVSGLEVLKEIRENYPDLPIVMVTGYNSVETAMEALRLGANGYVIKPFESKDILAMARGKIKN